MPFVGCNVICLHPLLPRPEELKTVSLSEAKATAPSFWRNDWQGTKPWLTDIRRWAELLWIKYCPSYNKINALWFLITTVMYCCAILWEVLKTRAGISLPAKPDSIPHPQEKCMDTRSSIFKCQLETKSVQLESSVAVHQYWHLQLLLILSGTATPSNLWKLGFQTQPKSCLWSTAPLLQVRHSHAHVRGEPTTSNWSPTSWTDRPQFLSLL